MAHNHLIMRVWEAELGKFCGSWEPPGGKVGGTSGGGMGPVVWPLEFVSVLVGVQQVGEGSDVPHKERKVFAMRLRPTPLPGSGPK